MIIRYINFKLKTYAEVGFDFAPEIYLFPF